MKKIDGELLKRCLVGAYDKLNQKKEEVNVLNVFPVPDGDTGTNMTLTMKSAISKIEKVESNSAKDIAKALGMGSLMGARGNSGVILSQLCRGISEASKGIETLQLEDFKDLFNIAKDKAYKAVMKPTEGTILTVARSISEFTDENISKFNSIEEYLKATLIYANDILKKTPDMLPALKEAGVVDAGGQGLVYLLLGFLEVLTGENQDELLNMSSSEIEECDSVSSDQEYEYEVKVKVKGNKDAFVFDAFGDAEFINGKAVIQTNSPMEILDKAMEMGEVLYFKFVSNNSDEEIEDEKEEEVEVTEKKEPAHMYGFASVSLGEGFDKIFKELMCDEIISGGQTMNPSTQDLYEAVEKIDAKNVFILPNNKNIIMAAEQVNELSDKNVYVVPTKTIPQGFMAMLSFDETKSPEENLNDMTESLSTIKTGQVTYAIRDTEMNGLVIKKDDYIGIMDGNIVAVSDSPEKLVSELIDRNIDDETSLITVYGGDGIKEEQFDGLKEELESKYTDFDVDFEMGNQPTYFYIFSIE